jgi:uncharacterized protein (TIGR03437 family)
MAKYQRCPLVIALLVKGILLTVLLAPSVARAQNIITTVAGSDWIFPDEGKQAVDSAIGRIFGITTDSTGAYYIADVDNHQVMMVSKSGVISVVAGNGLIGYTGDGGPARGASLGLPEGMVIDHSGNLYIATTLDNRVRRVAPDGNILVFAGNGNSGFSGDGGPATAASLNGPQGLAIDQGGNVYVADTGNNRIRRITPDGIISTVVGDGQARFQGDGGSPLTASLSGPVGLAVDSAGNLVVADTSNNRVRLVSKGTITTVAGTNGGGFSGDGGPATSAQLNEPMAIAIDGAGRIYIADSNNHRVRVINNGVINTFAGNGNFQLSGDGGPAVNASLNFPTGIALDTAGNLLIADFQNSRIRNVGTNGVISSVAGDGKFRLSADNIPAVTAVLSLPSGLALDQNENVYFTENQRARVRKMNSNGIITTVIGNGTQGFSGEGVPATTSSLYSPSRLALDSAGNLYVSDNADHRIRRVTSDGLIRTVAGTGAIGFAGDNGPATSASLNEPEGIAIDANNNLYIADQLNNRIRRVDTQGIITTFAGTGVAGDSGDGGSATGATLNQPTGVAADSGNIYVAERGGNRVRKISPNGTITTIAGTGAGASTGDGGPAVQASLNQPGGVAVDSNGNIYISELFGCRVRKISKDGTISTFAGTGATTFAGDGGPAANAAIYIPSDVKVDSHGNVFIADGYNNRIREVVAAGVTYQSATTTLSFSATAGGNAPSPQAVNLTSSIAGLAFTASSNASWLSATPASGLMPSALQVGADPTNLTAGTYQGTVTISSPNAITPALTVNVSFVVQAAVAARLSVASQNLSFSAVQGSAAQTGQLQIANPGGGTLYFSASSTTSTGGAWLSVSPSSGTATPSAPATLSISADPGSLAAGTYQGIISITGAGSTSKVAVTLSITAPTAVILLSQSGLAFTAVSQGGAPLPETFGILNTGQGSMNWSATASTLSGGANWLQISPASGTVTQPYLDVSTVNVTIDPTGLAAGDYYGRIQVSAPAANTPQLITVILTVLPAGTSPGPQVQPNSLIFTGVAGATPGSQDVLLGNPKAVPDSYQSANIGKGFSYIPAYADVLPNQPSTLRVYPDFTNLQPGVSRGTITLQFSDGTPRTVSVLIVVAPPSAVTSSSRLDPQASSCSSGILEVQWRSPAANFPAVIGQPTSLQVQVVDDCGNQIGPGNPQAAAVSATFSNKDPDLKLVHIGNGIWTGTWKPVNPSPGAVAVTVTAFNSTGSLIQSGQASLTGALTTSQTPNVTQGGVVHAASSASGVPIAPGSLITIYGSNLADAQGQSSTLPLPESQNGAQVLLGSTPLPILYTSSGQLNVQVPFNAPANTQYQLSVQRDSLVSLPEQLVVAQANPGVFTVNEQGSGQGVIFKSDGVTLAQPGSPANPGETVVIYCTGLGAVSPAVPDGTPPPSSPLSNTVNPVTVTIGGQNAAVSFSGLTPGYPGLYQINAVVPGGISGGAVPLVVAVAGQASPPVTLAVE